MRKLRDRRGITLTEMLCTVLIVLLRRRFGRIGFKRVLRELIKILACTAVCALVCLGLDAVVPEMVGTGRVLLRLVVCAGTALVVYVLCCLALRVKPLEELLGGLIHR